MANNSLHLSKRVQVDKAKALMFGIVIGVSVVSVFSLVASKSYFSQATYLNKVAVEKEKAVKQLKANKEAVNQLVKSYDTFSKQSPNLLGGSTTGVGEKDGDNGRLVLDALPSKYDFPALATSLEKLVSGYAIANISGSDESVAQAAVTESSEPVIIPITISVSTDYKGAQNLFNIFEKSIRPFQVLSFDLSGSNSKMQVNLTAQTYYQPVMNMKIETKVVK